MTTDDQRIFVCEKLLKMDVKVCAIHRSRECCGRTLPKLTLDWIFDCEERLAHLYPKYLEELFKLAPTDDPDLDPRTLWPLIHTTKEQRLAALVETLKQSQPVLPAKRS